MSNWGHKRNNDSIKIALSDILRNKNPRSMRLRTPLSPNEERELHSYLARKTLMLYDRDLDEYKEER